MPIRKAEAEATAPSHAAGSSDIVEELRRQYDRLTPSQKSIAEYVIEHAQEVAFSTVDQMAERVDVNPSTIVRFAYRLGLNEFTDLQERRQELVRGQLSRTGDPISESQADSSLARPPTMLSPGSPAHRAKCATSFSPPWSALRVTMPSGGHDGFMWSLNSGPSQSRSILRWCSIGCAATFRCLHQTTCSRYRGWLR